MPGRVWIFAFERELSPAAERIVADELRRFAAQWKAHGAAVEAVGEVRYSRFAVIRAPEEEVTASGCSIDGLYRTMQRVSEKAGVDLVESSSIAFRDGERISIVTRDEFRDLARRGRVNAETIVFDQSLRTLDEFLAGKWEVAVKDSWHRSLI
jgi:hypothetical protein